MPSQILHALFGDDVIAGLCSRLKDAGSLAVSAALAEITSRHRGAFVLGCQGPDVFYHNRRTRPSALGYGSLLHRRAYGVFSAGLFATSRHDSHKAYALGFMTHAALDRHCHPYIIYKSVDLEAGNSAENSHPFFERIIDVLMLAELRRQEVSSWDQGLLAETCENPPEGLKELVARALAAAFPERAGRDEKLGQRIDNAFADSARYYRLSDPAKTSVDVRPASIRHLSLVYPRNLPAEIDFLNLKQEPWYYPYRQQDEKPKPDTRSLVQVYSDAVQAAVDSLLPCMGQYLETGVFPVATAAETIGNGSLSIHGEDGKPCAPNFTSPLPLGDVLRDASKKAQRQAVDFG
ncbi:MAG: zinc dependent phospholipase C family protein [Treponema sp.]|jgi:hypothetical protein|nr:zinc dependent phospholipase C family protein [Treponema sp.]